MLAQEDRVAELEGLYRSEMALRKKYFNTIEGASPVCQVHAQGHTQHPAGPCFTCLLGCCPFTLTCKSAAGGLCTSTTGELLRLSVLSNLWSFKCVSCCARAVLVTCLFWGQS